nr:hypothetical protein [Tanacetum cinerariifolium]
KGKGVANDAEARSSVVSSLRFLAVVLAPGRSFLGFLAVERILLIDVSRTVSLLKDERNKEDEGEEPPTV